MAETPTRGGEPLLPRPRSGNAQSQLPRSGDAQGQHPRSAGPLLSVENLQTHFRTPDGVNRAVDGVSFHVAASETLAIVGESGCGKSVTAMSSLRLIPEPPGKIAGAIRFQGKDLLQLSAPEMRAIRGNEISMIFQEPMTSLNPVLNVGRQIGETVQLHQNMSRRHAEARAVEGQPQAIVLRTTPGVGVPTLVNRPRAHFVRVKDDEWVGLTEELEASRGR